MDRRDFVKQVLATTAAGVAAVHAVNASPTRTYESKTISIALEQGGPEQTLLYLTEHGDADYVIVEAFYWTTFRGMRVMLHKDTMTQVVKGTTSGADLPMNVDSIVFLRVRETKTLQLNDFGKPAINDQQN
jgi:hypothetical protein